MHRNGSGRGRKLQSEGYHRFQQSNYENQLEYYNKPTDMPMQMKHNGTYQAPQYCSRSPLAPLDNNRSSDYRLQNLDASTSSTSNEKNDDFENSNDMSNKENPVTQNANKSMDETSVAQMEKYGVGTVYSILLWENGITDMNEYDRMNEIFQILGDSYEGSQQLLAYLVDKQAGLLIWEEEETDSQTPHQINANVSLPAISLQELFPQYGKKDDGKRLIKYFNSCKVAKLIVAHEYNRTRKRIPADRLNKLAEAVAFLFPQAGPKQLWYQPAVTDNKGSHPSKGKLNRQNNEFSNVASGLCLFYSAEEPARFDVSTSSATFNELKTIETVDESVEKKWLNITLELEAYFEHATIPEIFESFPFLKTDDGLKLLLKHFDQKYPNLEGQFATKWFEEMQLILVKAIQLSIDNKYCKPDIVDKLPDAGSQMALALNVMPLLMRPVVCKRVTENVRSEGKTAKNNQKNNKSSPAVLFHVQDTNVVALESKNWTATKEEACDSFVKQIEIINAGTFGNEEIEKREQEQIHEHRQMLLAKYLSHELPLTGYVVIVGPINKIKKSILFIDNYSFEFVGVNSTVRAAEACFKTIKLLGKEFPKAASAAWEYIQSNILSMPVVGALQTTTEFRTLLRTKYTPTPRGTRRPKKSKPTPKPGEIKSRKRKADVGATA